MILVISASLNPSSRSRILANAAIDELKSAGVDYEHLDLRDIELPFCDGASAYSHDNVAVVAEKIASASGVLFACPVYNFDINSAAKNLVELTGKHSWSEKVVGFLLAAGGRGSYMSVMPFANSLMLDFRCLIVPRFVFTVSESFDGERIVDEGVNERIVDLVDRIQKITRVLN